MRRKGFSPDAIDVVVAELETKGLLGDALLARDLIESGQKASKSRSRVYADLRKRGIARELAEDSLNAYFDPEMEREAAVRLVRKTFDAAPVPLSRAEMESEGKRLSRRGFSPYAVSGALSHTPDNSGENGETAFLDTDSQLS